MIQKEPSSGETVEKLYHRIMLKIVGFKLTNTAYKTTNY